MALNNIRLPISTQQLVKLSVQKSHQPEHISTSNNIPTPNNIVASWGDGTLTAQACDLTTIEQAVIERLRSIYDPEISVNLYDLGLIYGIDIDADAHVHVRMTLTAPACPVADSLVQEVAQKVGELESVSRATVELVWDPPWSQDKLSDAARLELGLF